MQPKESFHHLAHLTYTTAPLSSADLLAMGSSFYTFPCPFVLPIPFSKPPSLPVPLAKPSSLHWQNRDLTTAQFLLQSSISPAPCPSPTVSCPSPLLRPQWLQLLLCSKVTQWLSQAILCPFCREPDPEARSLIPSWNFLLKGVNYLIILLPCSLPSFGHYLVILFKK